MSRAFDIDTLPSGFFAAFLGIRRSGKTHLAKYILSHLSHRWHRIFVFTGTAYSRQWQPLLGAKRVFDEYLEERLMGVIEAQKKKLETEKKAPSICVVLDDIIGMIKPTSNALKILATSGRHLGITVFLLQQRLQAVGPTVRDNCDALFLFSQLGKDTIDEIFNEALQGIHALTKNAFYDTYTDVAEGFRCLVVSKTTKSNKQEDHLFFLEAPSELDEHLLQ